MKSKMFVGTGCCDKDTAEFNDRIRQKQDIIADFVTGHIIYLNVIMWWREADLSTIVIQQLYYNA